jgi:hypothetical protein
MAQKVSAPVHVRKAPDIFCLIFTILTPVEFVEDDGTVHHVQKWDPTPVRYSGFMGCVTHSIVVTDQGTFEVGRYPAVNIETFSKVWQWFIHRKID